RLGVGVDAHPLPVGEEALHLVCDLQFDGFVFHLLTGRAAIGRDQGGSGRRAPYHEGGAAMEARERGQPDGGQQHPGGEGAVSHHSVSPRSRTSMPSHSACSSRMWTSWMRIVRSWGTQRWMSVSWSMRPISPPPLPVRAMTVISRSCAASIAVMTLAELPLVEVATRASPGWPRALTWRSKTELKP